MIDNPPIDSPPLVARGLAPVRLRSSRKVSPHGPSNRPHRQAPLWRGSLLPLGSEAAPNPAIAIHQANPINPPAATDPQSQTTKPSPKHTYAAAFPPGTAYPASQPQPKSSPQTHHSNPTRTTKSHSSNKTAA